MAFPSGKAIATTPDNLPQQLQAGDLILRSSEGLLSDFARQFSASDKRYSHIGIIALINNQPHVVHAIHDQEKNQDGVVTETLADFLQPANAWSVYRLTANASQRQRVASQALSYAGQGVRFDMQFNIDTTDSMYCTELIWHALDQSLPSNPITPGLQQPGARFITVQDTYTHPHIKFITSNEAYSNNAIKALSPP